MIFVGRKSNRSVVTGERESEDRTVSVISK